MYKQPFNIYSTYYDLLYSDKDYRGEADYVAQILHRFNPDIKNLIELGSGTGNYAQHLCSKGFEITGIEKSEGMFLKANLKNIPGFSCVHADMVDFKLNETYDAAISLFHVISYLTKDQDIIDCFKNIASHLNQNGLFFFDIWYSPAVNFLKPSARIKHMENSEFRITRHAEPIVYDNNIVEVDYEVIITNKITLEPYQIHEKHVVRHFNSSEIAEFAQKAGFTLLHSEEFLTAKKPGVNTWGVCYTLKKND